MFHRPVDPTAFLSFRPFYHLKSNLLFPEPSCPIVTNRFVSAFLVLSFVGVCFSYQGGADPGLSKGKPEDKDRMVVKMAVQIPTPKENEVVLILDSGDFVTMRLGQIATIPATEKFRTIVGENASFSFVEKGTTSGNNFWRVERR